MVKKDVLLRRTNIKKYFFVGNFYVNESICWVHSFSQDPFVQSVSGSIRSVRVRIHSLSQMGNLVKKSKGPERLFLGNYYTERFFLEVYNPERLFLVVEILHS